MFNKIKNHIFTLHEKIELLIAYGVIMFALGMGMNYLFSDDPKPPTEVQATNDFDDDYQYPYASTQPPDEDVGYSEYINEIVVAPNDHLAKILEREGVDRVEAYHLTTAIQKKYNLRNLNIGQKITTIFAEDIDSDSGEVVLTNLTIHEVDRDIQATRRASKDYNVEVIYKKLTKESVYVSGLINSSLYVLASKLGVPPNIIADFMKAYSYDIDFQRDIQKNSRFDVMYEVLYDEDGNKVRDGNLIYGLLNARGKDFKIYRFASTGKDKDADYYNEDGKQLRKFLLKTPIDGAVISSPFGRRRHPISGYSKMHKGVDFAAKRNTPFYAGGDGKIVYIGRKGGYGNYIRIKHANKYETAYAHIHRFAKGMRKGRRVKQGQVIAYVGSTGNSTGPHLHYEILKNGKQINPLKLKIPSGKELKGKSLKKFKVERDKIEEIINSNTNSRTIKN